MKILAIETSCDETALALLECTETDQGIHFHVDKNITHTQVEHAAFGGVYPNLAKREHQKNLPIILEQINPTDVDYICVTSGPGLEPALWTGITFAQELSQKLQVPLIPVNHMEGHILSIIVPPTSENDFSYKKDSLQFPALAVLVSGGHTELVLVNNIGDYKIIGRTVDDAVGEAFDKVARILGLPYPGGPEISKLADEFSGTSEINFPKPMIHSKDYNFSFSGLKTAVLYYVRNNPNYNPVEVAYAFQEAATDVLVIKTKKAIEEFGIQSVIVGGGVSANKRLREKLARGINTIPLHFPALKLTGDNALMIALVGYFKIKQNPNATYPEIKAQGNLLL